MTALEELGLDPVTATEADVKLCIKKLAMKHHPDKGGNATKFHQVMDLKERALSEVENGAALTEAKLQMQFRERRRPVCLACEGTGLRTQASEGFRTLNFKCRKCNGRGWVRKTQKN